MSESFEAKAYVATLPRRPGVYRMLGAKGELLYVGKARNLRSRVASYFHARNVVPKVQALVGQVTGIDVTLTDSDGEALLLEYNLIKEHRPRFNVMLRDDKSFPYVHVTTEAKFPRLTFYRGPRVRSGRLFGPYPSAGATRETLLQLQKLFKLRNCEDTFFENRSRPCLQHQIERCSAPCVGLISEADYSRDVAAAVKVLEGRSEEVNEELARAMDQAASALDYETAARLRDQLASLRQIQLQQSVSTRGRRDTDLVALASEGGEHCVAVMFVRARAQSRQHAVLSARTPGRSGGDHECVSHAVLLRPRRAGGDPAQRGDRGCRGAAGCARGARGHKVVIRRAPRGLAARWMAMAQTNAAQALRMRLASRAGIELDLQALRETLQMPEAPHRIECFDISHTRGEGTVASCVVFGREGPIKADYRRFNISGVRTGR